MTKPTNIVRKYHSQTILAAAQYKYLCTIRAIAAVTWAQQLAEQDQRLADMLTMP